MTSALTVGRGRLERAFGASVTVGGLAAMLWAAVSFSPGQRLLDDVVTIGLVAVAAWYGWRILVRPAVRITESEVTILNGVRVYRVPVGQVAGVSTTSTGISIRTEDGEHIEPVIAGASILSSLQGHRRRAALRAALERVAQQKGAGDGTRTSSRIRLEAWPFIVAATACILAVRL